MKGFFQLISSSELLSLLDQFSPLEPESVSLAQGLNRVLHEDIHAPEPLPPFARSTMDGFAVRARDTFGCGDSEPALLNIVNEIRMGESGSTTVLNPGEACTIWTGGELPAKADAVVMVEFTSQLDDKTIEVFRPVAPGENVIQYGEDYQQHAPILNKGHQLRPQDLGVLAGCGITETYVYKQPTVAIISTGDELVSIDKQLAPGKIRDINSTTLASLVLECGGIPIQMGIFPDNLDSMQKACEKSLGIPADMILLSGGSSVGRRDFTLNVLEGIENSTILAHGVSIKPGKPTILAKQENKAFFGLPGHVGSAIVVFQLFVRPLIRKYMGLQGNGLQKIMAITAEQIPSTIGREDFVRVSLTQNSNSLIPLASPVYGKSGLLNPLVKADGLLIIDRDTEGLDKGVEGEVLLFQ